MARPHYFAVMILVAACSSKSSPGGAHLDGGSSSHSDGNTGGTDGSGNHGGSDAGAVTGVRCTSPTATLHDMSQSFSPTATSSTPQASGWDVYDNQWSCSNGACLNETAYACNAGSWYATSNLTAGNTAVLTYVSTQVNFPLVQLSTFTSIASTFSEVSPHDATGVSSSFGDYEAAYDVFFGSGNANEIMVWVDNNGQTPINGNSPQKTGVDIGGTTWNVYFGGTTTSWVAQTNFHSGSVDLLSIFNYTTATLHNFDATAAAGYLNQIQFGWELCSTNGSAETFYLDAFTVNAQ